MSGVEIRVRSNSRQARQDLGRLERSVEGINKTVGRLSKGLVAMTATIGTAFAATSLTRNINKATDALTDFENRVALVTGRGEKLNKTIDDLYRISKRTRGSVAGSAETFNRFGLALKSSGKSAEEILRAVESVNKAVAISGTGAESARAALFQLGQGLASGQLRGQELNSVLEQAPRLAQAIADAMGEPLGALRKIAEQGRITTTVVFDALISQSGKLGEEFKLMEQTSSQAMAVLKDQIGRVTGEVSKQLGITSGFIERVNRLSNYIEANRQEIVAGISSFGRSFITSFNGVTATLGGLLHVLKAIGGRFVDALPRVITPLRQVIDMVSFVGAAVFLNFSAAIRRAGLDLGGFAASLTGFGFMGSLRKLFNARNLEEFGAALYDVGDAIDSYGRRWYNVGNKTERIFRRTKFRLTEMAISLGILEQKLVRFRYVSFERFGKSLSIISEGFRQIGEGIKSSQVFVNLQLAILQVIQLLKRVGNAIYNSVGRPLESAFVHVSNLFKGTLSLAKTYLGAAWKFVDTTLNSIERKFFWLYDEVIQNSWWTDTMEGVFGKAQEWLPRALSLINGFAKKVEQTFFQLNRDFDFFQGLSKKDKTLLVKVKLAFMKKDLKNFLSNLGESASSAISDSLTTIRSLSPSAFGWLTVGVTGALVQAFGSAGFKKSVGKVFGPTLAIGLVAAIANLLGDAFNGKDIGRLIGEGIGQAFGSALNQLIQALPELTKALFQAAKGFGSALTAELGLNIFTFIPKLIGSIPLVGGVMNTILFGMGGAALFFKKTRKPLKNLLGGLGDMAAGYLTTPGRSGSVGPALSQLLVGSASDRMRMLGTVGATVAMANSLLGETLGTGAASAIGLGGGLFMNALFSGMTPSQIMASVSSVTTSAMGNFKKMFAFINSGNIATWFSGLISQVRLLGLSSAITSGTMTASFTGAFATIAARGSAAFSMLTAKMFKMSSLLKGGLIFGALFAGTAAFAGTGAEGAAGGMGLGGLLATVATLGLMIPDLTGKVKKLGSNLKNVIPQAKGMALAATMNSALAKNTAGGAASKAAGAATFAAVTGASFARDIVAGLTRFKWAKALGNGFKKIGAALKRGLSKLISRSIFTAIRTAILAAFGSIASLAVAPFAAIAAAIAAAGLLVYMALNKAEEDIFSKTKRLAGGVLRYFNLTNDNSVLKGEAAQSTGRKLNSEGYVSDKLLEKLEDTSFSTLNDTTAYRISDTLEKLEKLSKQANSERKSLGIVSESTREKLIKAQEAATTAIREGNDEGNEQAEDNLKDFQGGVGKAVDDALPGFFSGLYTSFMSWFPGEGTTKSKEAEELGKLLESVKSESFDTNEYQFVSTLQDLSSKMDIGGSLESATDRRYLEFLFGDGVLQSRVTDEAREILSLMVREITSNSRATADGYSSGHIGVSKNLEDTFFAAFAEAQSQLTRIGFGPLKPTEAKSNFLASLGEAEENELFLANRKLAESFVKTALEANDFGSGLRELSRLNLSEHEAVFGAQFALENAEFELDRKLSERAEAAGNKDDYERVNAEVNLKLAEVEALKAALREVVGEAMLTAIEQTPRARLTRALGTLGLSEEIASEFGRGFVEGAENSFLGIMETVSGYTKEEAMQTGRSVITSFGNSTLIPKYTAEEFDNAVLKQRSDFLQQELDLHKHITQELEKQDDTGVASPEQLARIQDLLDAQERATERVATASQIFSELDVDNSEIAGLLQSGASLTTVENLDLSKLYQVGPSTARGIAELAAAMMLLQSASINPDLAEGLQLTEEQIKLKLVEFQGLLDGFFKGAPKMKSSETVFEKFVGGLNAAGFSLDMQTAAEISTKTILAMRAPLKLIEKAQKRIKNASLADNEARKQSLAIIEEQRGKLAYLFSTGTMAQAAIGLDSLNVDTSVLDFNSEEAFQRAVDIASLQERLNNTLFSDYDTRKAISAEIERQQYLLEGITVGAENSALAIADSLKTNIQDVLSGAKTLKEGIFGILDTISERIIGTVVDSFVEAFMETTGMKDFFKGIFEGLFNFGGSIGENVGKEILGGLQGATSSGGLLSGLLGSGGGGGLFSSIFGLSFGSFLGMNTGGVVPSTSYSRAGVDSVPTMLTPGELVVPANKVNQFMSSKGAGQQSVYNINVSGDVSRQTRSEIVRMIPQITQGVNMTNKERRNA